jgi:hypothetical protein
VPNYLDLVLGGSKQINGRKKDLHSATFILDKRSLDQKNQMFPK